MLRYLAFLWILLLGLPQTSWAAWHVSSSDNFVIYADQPSKIIAKYSDRLERYHNAMAANMGMKKTNPSPSNRVTVYVVGNVSELRKLLGGKQKYAAGFYVSRAGSSVAFVPTISVGSNKANFSEIILLHEYAHHFMYSKFQRSFPLWFREGFAEFYASANFYKNGSVGIGLPAEHRAGELEHAKKVSIDKLLVSQNYLQNKSSRQDDFYGRSWLLFHYLFFSEERKGQMQEYVKQLYAGKSEMAAAKAAFGDLNKLQRKISGYQYKGNYIFRKLGGPIIQPGPISVRKLDKAEAEMMPFQIRLKRGASKGAAAQMLPEIRSLLNKYPENPTILARLAEAEFRAGNDQMAIAVADRALAKKPKLIDALLQKGYAMVRMARDAEDKKSAWSAVRNHFIKINKLENDHPIPLFYYYLSFRNQPGPMPKQAIAGLHHALSLAPFDEKIRISASLQYMKDGKFGYAAKTLEPMANNPHGSKLKVAANKYLEISLAKLKAAKDQKREPKQ